MSRQMKGFSDYFMQGLQLGAGWAEKWEAQQIAAQRNKIMSERNAAVDRRENAKLGLYGEQVRANAELARARAHAALNPKAKGGGGGGVAPSSADAEALRREAAERGIISAPPAAPAPAPSITINQSSSDGGTTPDLPAPVEAGYGDGMAKGGMVRPKRYAEGGIVGGMTLEEAMKYQGVEARPEPAKPAGGGVLGALGGALAKGAANYKEPEEKAAETVTPRGPMGSGVGGSYTTADTGPGGVISTNYRAGGTVRKFQSGGRVLEAIDTGTSGPGSGYGYRAAPPARSY